MNGLPLPPSVPDARDRVIAAAQTYVLDRPVGSYAELSSAVRSLEEAEETWGLAIDLVRGAEERAAAKEKLATDAWAEVRRLKAEVRSALPFTPAAGSKP